MLRSMKDLEDYAIGATDGSVGHVKDFLFDDDAWVIRYFVVKTGAWLASRKVLISPIAVLQPDWKEKLLPVAMSKEQVRNSPDIDTDKPISRQHEYEYFGFYGYPYYWGGAGLWGSGMYPYALYPGYTGYAAGLSDSREAGQAFARIERPRQRHDDPHLRSCKAVVGYHIHATDGDIGHVSGLLVDERTWAVRYLVVATSNWGLGHEVLIAPEWIDEVRWIDEKVAIDVSRQAVKDAPPYDSTKQLSREEEKKLYRHYDRSGYWSSDLTDERASTPRQPSASISKTSPTPAKQQRWERLRLPSTIKSETRTFRNERTPEELEIEAANERTVDDVLRAPRRPGWTTRDI